MFSQNLMSISKGLIIMCRKGIKLNRYPCTTKSRNSEYTSFCAINSEQILNID